MYIVNDVVVKSSLVSFFVVGYVNWYGGLVVCISDCLCYYNCGVDLVRDLFFLVLFFLLKFYDVLEVW